MTTEATYQFLEQCAQEYCSRMEFYLSTSHTKSEFRDYHEKIKKPIIVLHKNKWNKSFHSAGIVPLSNLRELLEEKIEEKFQVVLENLETKLSKLSASSSKLPTSDKTPALGIDLGTTQCCVMAYHDGKVTLIPNRAQGNKATTPSYVAFHQNGSITFGKTAKDQSHRFPENTIFEAKRMIGRAFSDSDLQDDLKHWPFEVINVNGQVKVECGGKNRFPHEISGILLNKLREMAEAYFQMSNGSITKAVITVPAYFTEPQRRATRKAAESVGLEVVNILSEPTAAAIAYNFQWNQDKGHGAKNVLVYDLGGGTFDVAIARVDGKGVAVLGVDGDTHLGGQDIDKLLMEHCEAEFFQENGVNLRDGLKMDDKIARDKSRRALSRLKQQCEKLKEQLSSAESAEVEIPCIYQNLDMVVTVDRETLETMASPLIQKTIEIVERAVHDAKGKGVAGKQSIDEIILVGGSTRMPLVVEMLEQYFGCKAHQQINPDEAVAYGAAIQAAIMTGKLESSIWKETEIKDVTPLSLGIECAEDETCVLIPRNATLPAEWEKVFTTDMDFQTSLRITVVQGEEDKASKNKKLGEFFVYDIPPKRAGIEKFIVSMTIDSMGILEVKARSLTGDQSKAMKITAQRLDSDSDLER